MKCALLFIMLVTTKAVMCSECPEGCTSCSSSDICTKCDEGYILRGEACYFTCPPSCRKCGFRVCHECKPGYYGEFCQIKCDSDCQTEYCDKGTGACAKKEEQAKTTASVECNELSGQRCIDDCPKNCETCGDENNKCLSCNIGFWGDDCDYACNDECEQTTCEKETGWCAPAYTTTTHTMEDTQTCQSGRYGKRCEKECPENCLKSLCFKDNGTCVGDCPDGHFGERCNRTCLTKCTTSGCHRLDGTCFDDCTDGKEGDDCRQAPAAAQDTDNDDDDGTTKIIIGGGVGSFGVAIATVVVVVILVLRMKLRRTREYGREDHQNL